MTPPTIDLTSSKLVTSASGIETLNVSLKTTKGAALTFTLVNAKGKVIATWTASAANTGATLSLKVPKAAKNAGKVTLKVAATANGKTTKTSSSVRV